MINQEINIAIAEACGMLKRPAGQIVEYRRPEPQSSGVFERVRFPDGSVRPCYVSDLPNYCNDLNAMNEAEKVLQIQQTPHYVAHLQSICGSAGANAVGWPYITATARQRAEAFLRVKGLWKE